MNSSTNTSLNWIAVIASMTFVVWAVMDIYNRGLFSEKTPQEFVFSEEESNEQVVLFDLQPVINQHLFGVVPVEKKEVEKQIVAPKTNLNLILTGLMKSVNEAEAHAIIDVGRGKMMVVRVGDQIGDTGASLHSVEDQHIIIEHRGKLEKLQIERQQLMFADTNAQTKRSIQQLNIDENDAEKLGIDAQ